MAELPAEAVREFMALYRQEYGIDLDPKEAAMRARNLLNLYAVVLLDEPDTRKDSVPP